MPWTKWERKVDRRRGGLNSRRWLARPSLPGAQRRFKFSIISSGMFGAATEFGKFSTVSRGGVHPVGVRGGGGHGYAGQAGGIASGSHGGHEVRDDQSWEGPGGMKRKLFSEPAGPQLLE